MDNENALVARVPPLPSLLPRWLPREINSHKGSLGSALVLAGSVGMSGAAILAGRSALAGGSGLVRVGAPRAVSHLIATGNPCYMVQGLEDDGERIRLGAWTRIKQLCEKSTAFAIGPGLGRAHALDLLVERVQTQVALPGVFDADALNALASRPVSLTGPAGPRIFTPHLGELARLLGLVNMTREFASEQALSLARRWKCVLVVKGPHSIVTDGERFETNETGNPGLATGGSGDVLTGLLVALLAQGLGAWEAARLGTWLHGFAGDLAAKEWGENSMTAQGVIDRLPQAIVAFQGASRA